MKMASSSEETSPPFVLPANSSAAPRTNESELKGVIMLQSREDLNKILNQVGNKYLVIEFFADWCGPCRLVATKLDNWIKIYDIIILKIDVDEFEDIAIEYEVSAMPQFLVMKDKQKLQSFEGSNTEKIENYLEKFCQRAPVQDNSSIKMKSRPSTNVTRLSTSKKTQR